MLDANIKTQLKGYLERLQQPIESSPASTAAQARRRCANCCRTSPAFPARSPAQRRHATRAGRRSRIGRAGETPRVHFAGMPMGHEFTSLVLALLQAGGHPPKVERGTVIEQMRSLQGEFDFETYISLTCHNCPDVVQALNLMAVLNPGITHTMIDGALFQDEVEQRQIMAVPTVYLNGEEFGQGRMELERDPRAASTPAPQRARPRSSTPGRPSTCSSSAAARRARLRRCMPPARASAPAWWPSVSAAR